jgi:DNA polymerase-3 subunit gamma/tau
MLSSAAQNSLLKELESPPSYAHFVLCTTEPRKVLPTIIDRSIHFELPPIPSDRIAGRLAAVCSREGIAAEEGALSLIAKEASGSMRRALKLLEKIGGANVTEADAALILGRTGAEAALQVIELLLKGDRGSCFSLLDAADREGKGFSSLFRDAIDVLLDAFRVRLFKGTGCLPGRSEEERGRIVEVAKKLSHRRISELSAVFQDGLAELNRGISPQLSVGIVTISRAGEALMEGTA